ncbi:MAG: hypothetical protein R3195_04835 [Gemmatimonadota bacterium]|nr:hypothetical protein [Gemmatimonadota bacterium]
MMGKMTRKMGLSTAFASVAFLPIIGSGACAGDTELETQTFELQYMNPGEAVEMIAPYVYPEREAAPGLVTHFSGGLTVRETRENLARIREVLESYDLPTPGVRLHFQLIEANGYGDTDPRISDVQDALEELFRFDGYRLLAEPQMAAMEGTGSTQRIPEADGSGFYLEARIQDIRGRGDKASIVLSVSLMGDYERIETSMAVPVGETVVLGSSQGDGSSTIILTVRPQFVDVS